MLARKFHMNSFFRNVNFEDSHELNMLQMFVSFPRARSPTF